MPIVLKSGLKNSCMAKKLVLNHQMKSTTSFAINIKADMPKDMQEGLEASSQKEASSWLSQHDLALHKSAIRDALCLRYGWNPSNHQASSLGDFIFV